MEKRITTLTKETEIEPDYEEVDLAEIAQQARLLNYTKVDSTYKQLFNQAVMVANAGLTPVILQSTANGEMFVTSYEQIHGALQ